MWNIKNWPGMRPQPTLPCGPSIRPPVIYVGIVFPPPPPFHSHKSSYAPVPQLISQMLE